MTPAAWRGGASISRSFSKVRPQRSRRPLQLAAAIRDGTRGLHARHQLAHRKQIIRVALRRVHLTDEDGAHQLMMAVSEQQNESFSREIRANEGQ